MSEKEKHPNCVFLEEIKCRVRHEIQASTRIEKLMSPLTKKDDRTVALQIGKRPGGRSV